MNEDNFFTRGQQSLKNFVESMAHQNPAKLAVMHGDISTVAINACGANKDRGQEAADRLRRHALDLPEIHKRVLDRALSDLGYS